MNDATDLIRALTGLAWPVFAAWVVWRLLPEIRHVLEKRNFSLKVGNNELTVQEFSDKVVETTADFQQQLAARTGQGQTEQQPQPGRVLRRILWVDDVPSNNAYEAGQLQAMGVEVVQAKSTDEGLQALQGAQQPFDAVISDMGRSEGSEYDPDAGVRLIERIRETDASTPVFVYGGAGALTRRDEVAEAGGNGVTQSPTELFALLGQAGRFPKTAA
ncbi:response regulator [Streptomyces fulvoviolaceus]|uniref:response regulator n=1 Tax=Streptomyces fulvoviolaceus TaxID=285535 RepID=UPI0021C1E47F|nr:response regulator [Streptomyces fulvoviolaceus]MCT9076933.1 response regulator [Streptomyces fulvoviolaceus]